jgi:lysophospholipase L1-like esterase
MTRRPLSRLVPALVAVLLLAGCGATVTPDPVPDDDETPAVLADGGRVVVLGDSISLGMNACGTGPCPDASWASGTDPGSLTRRAAAVSSAIEVVTLARDGARLGTAVQYLDAILDEKPDLTIAVLGANDACATSVDGMTSPDEFRSQLTTVLGELRAGAPDAPILVMSVIDVNRVWEVAHGIGDAVRVWNSGRSCDALLADPDSTSEAATARRDQVAQRVDEFNAIITEVCLPADGCFTDGGALNDVRFETGDLSTVDYFHPSAVGQRKVADAVWGALSAIPADGTP